ncbi:unnamed protein product [Calicophoron daubneyi]|uniref:Radial spoke head protein 3 homolog n=1 Tax=Calicophoron daubneyi TaxID=300641 RepID=A0AAV2U124_CALDB
MTSVLPERKVEGTYSFASEPQATARRTKYREGELLPESLIASRYGNLMYDRRVIRGNTYALHILPAEAQTDPVELHRQIEHKRRAIARRRQKDEIRPSSPLPLDGRLHKPIQTELYLEALTDYIEEGDNDCQTDAFLDRPPTPLYVAAKLGSDEETQILQGDLFDFMLEVQPVLEVLVGKTLEQALVEVLEEEELTNIREQQQIFEEIRQVDLVEVHRLIERDRRIREEKEKRKAERIITAAREQELADKVAAQAFARAYLSDLQNQVFTNLTENGYFYDPVEYDVENGFLFWLMDEVSEELELENRSRLLLDGMIREVVQERHLEYRRLDMMEEEQSLGAAAGTGLTKQETVEDKTPIEDVNLNKAEEAINEPSAEEPLENPEIGQQPDGAEPSEVGADESTEDKASAIS